MLGISDVAGISIRLRILKVCSSYDNIISHFSCRDIDPVEDTESPLFIYREYSSLCCRDIDPVEDTESEKQGDTISDQTTVAGISIRLRILKAQKGERRMQELSEVAGISIRLRILKVSGTALSLSGTKWLQGYRSG